jgi:hypothetical protein
MVYTDMLWATFALPIWRNLFITGDFITFGHQVLGYHISQPLGFNLVATISIDLGSEFFIRPKSYQCLTWCSLISH